MRAAFLQDGAADLTLAAAAEEVARDMCRADAKRIFYERVRPLASASDGPAGRAERSDASQSAAGAAQEFLNFPRPWLVSSYFLAYDLLSASLGLYYDNINKRTAVAFRPSTASRSLHPTSPTLQASDIHDIDEHDGSGSGSGGAFASGSGSLPFPAPPEHLLQLLQEQGQEQQGQEQQGQEQEPRGPMQHQGDANRAAYLLLVALTELFEIITFRKESASAAHADVVEGSAADMPQTLLHADEMTVPLQLAPSASSHFRIGSAESIAVAFNEAADSGAAGLDSEGKLGGAYAQPTVAPASRSIAEDLDAGTCAVADVPAVRGTVGEAPPCAHYGLALALLRGTALQWQCSDCSNENQRAAVVRQLEDRVGSAAVRLLLRLSADRVEQLTAVSFAADGSAAVHSTADRAGAACKASTANGINCDGRTVASEGSVANPLRARLQNICGSVAYLAGDALGAVACFKASLALDPLLLDSQVKLGSLLVDMDELPDAEVLLREAEAMAPSSATVLLHLAEMDIHRNSFAEALASLRKGMRLTNTSSLPDDCGEAAAYRAEYLYSLQQLVADIGEGIGGKHASIDCKANGYGHSNGQKQQQLREIQNELKERYEGAMQEAQANVMSLMGVTLFRANPMRPEIALDTLRRALQKFHSQQRATPILLLCCGEVHSQAGDVVQALDCFRRAHLLAPTNPLSLVNAARTYQQLGHLRIAQQHLHAALKLDPAMAMVRVDLAQNMLLSGQVAQALQQIEEALQLAKQVSEIKDVLTARVVAEMQREFEENKMYAPPLNNWQLEQQLQLQHAGL